MQASETTPTNTTERRLAAEQDSAFPGSNLSGPRQRFLTLDAYRGLIMLLLVSDGFGFAALGNNPVFSWIAGQFEHRPWGGAVFYDLIMPAFLFMAGVAIPFSLARRSKMGLPFRENLRHNLVRALRLILVSEILVSIQEGRAHLSVHNVLTVVAVTSLACLLLAQLPFWKQAAVAAALLVLHSAVYLLFPGPDGAFAQVTNAGARFDRWAHLASCNLPWQCVTINLLCEIPTVLFGVWAGNLLRSDRPRSRQIQILAAGMVSAFVLGLAFSPLVPINKWLWTATYTLYTTGWSILGLLILYLAIEVLGHRRPVFFLTVAGRNSLFVYCVAGLFYAWIDRSLALFTGEFKWIGDLAPVAQSCLVLFVIWYLAYWLYKRGVFITA